MLRYLKMQIRVALTGAHSTGKSTLLAECKKRYGTRLHAIENIARSLIARGVPMGDKAGVQGLLEYARAQLDAELSAPSSEIIVSDRTCLDSYAYARANADLGLPSAVPEYVTDLLGVIARRESEYYHLYVYFPIEFPPEFDPVRPGGGEKYRQAVDRRIVGFLRQFSIPYSLSRGDVSTRASALFQEIDGLSNQKL